MARYIDADELLNKLPDDLPYKASVKRVLIQAQEADVVPKSEIEYGASFYFELEKMEERGKQLMREHDAEIAREIFEELEFDIHQLMFERDEHRAIAIEGIIAELKKKYTEDQSGE